MAARDAYLFYEAGQAVAAAHLGLRIKHISNNPAQNSSHITFPRNEPKARMILWLTGMAAEKKGVGRSDPLRRMRNRARIRTLVESAISTLTGARGKRLHDAKALLNQAQDRANAICSDLYPAIEQIVAKLRTADTVSGEEVIDIVHAIKSKRSAAWGGGLSTIEETSVPSATVTPPPPPPSDPDNSKPAPAST